MTALAIGGIYLLSKGKPKNNSIINPATSGSQTNPIASGNQTNPIEEIKEILLEQFKKDGKFDKGKAFLNGKEYTGKIVSNSDDCSLVLEYKDSVLQKSTKIAKDGKSIYEKSYDGNVITIARGDDTKVVDTSKKHAETWFSGESLKTLSKEENLILPEEEFNKKLNNIKYKSEKQVRELIEARTKALDEKGAKEYLKQIEKDSLEAENKLRESDSRNAFWVYNQKEAKEIEYSKWWKNALEEKEKPYMEANAKIIEDLKKEYKAGLADFMEKHKDDVFPSVEERMKLYAGNARTDYGDCYVNALTYVRRNIEKQTFEQYLKSLWSRTPRAEELRAEIAIKSLNPEQYAAYNKVSEFLKQRGVIFNKANMATFIKAYLHNPYVPEGKMVKGLLKNEFIDKYGYSVNAHYWAYEINGALRAGYEVDDIIKVLLDEGFKDVEPLERELLLYRQVHGGAADKSIEFINTLMNSKVGDTFVDKGYSYSSIGSGGAVSCNGIYDKGTPVIEMKIIAPKGSKISDGTHFEQREFLFPRNAEFRIVETPKLVRKSSPDSGGLYEMIVEYVLPNVVKN